MGRASGGWRELAKRVGARGGVVREPPRVAAPLDAEGLAALEADLGLPLPEPLLRLALNTGAIHMSWALPDDAPVFGGGYEGGVFVAADLPGLRDECAAWDGGTDSPEDRLFQEAVPFAGVDGAYLALRGDAVVFLEHEADAALGHGRVLAPDLRRFLLRWTACGAPVASDCDALADFLGADGLEESSPAREALMGWLED
ncbi:MAG: hypothetical protein AB8I08_10270 [Sandaracinaceae bacterium]